MSLSFVNSTADRVEVSASLSRTPDAVSFLLWHYANTQTANRRLWGIGDSATFANDFKWTFGAATTLNTSFSRAVGSAAATGNKTYTTNKWWFNAVTLTVGAAPKIFFGDLTTSVVEDGYSSSGAGTSGSLIDDSGVIFRIGNIEGFPFGSTPTSAYEGRIAVFARVDRDMPLGELKDWQFRPRVVANTAMYFQLGYNGTGTQPDWSGNGFSGTVTGATINTHVPLSPFFGFDLGWQGAFTAAVAAATTKRLAALGVG